MESDKRKTKAQLVTELETARQRLRELEKYSVVEKSNDGIIILQDGLVKFANARATQIFGFSLEETQGKPFIDFIAPQCRREVAETYRKRLLGENIPSTYETGILDKTGAVVPVEVNASLVEFEGRTATLAIVRDISERQKYADSLKASEDKFRTIFNDSSDGIGVYFLTEENEPGGFIEVNSTLCTWLGYKYEEAMALTAKDVTKIESGSLSFKDAVAKLRAEGKLTIERPLLTKDGREIPVEVSAHLSMYQGKEIIITILRNISARKTAERLLRESEAKFKTLAEKSPNMVFINRAGKIVYANPQCEESMGYRLNELYDAGFSFMTLVAPENTERITTNFMKHASGLEVSPVEYTLITKNGSRIECILSTKLIDYEGSKAILGVVTDISNRKQVEEALKLQAELLDLELDSVYVVDFDGNFLYVNNAVCATHGYTKEELSGMKLNELDDPEAAKLIPSRFNEILSHGGAMFELNHRHKNGSLIPLEVHASVAELRGKKVIMNVARGISERRKIQQQLMTQDRLASIGQLVSGVAHELNNPLTSVVGFSELLLQKNLPADLKADLKIVNDEAKRTALIVKNLLIFARQQPQEKQVIDINEPVQTVLQLRSHELSTNNLKVNVHLAPGLPLIMGNSSQLQQVFFNIIINAEQAILEARNKGTLTFTTEQKGNFVRASIADDGPGISRENMARLFSPFFTTKPIGKGTGLGLSICQGIISEHGGRIWAESEQSKGATFFVELPVYK